MDASRMGEGAFLQAPVRCGVPAAHGATPSGVTLRILDPGLLEARPALDDLAAAFVDSRLELEGPILPAIGVAARLGRSGGTPDSAAAPATGRDRGDPSLPLDFFRLWLDAELVMSCAHYASGREGLAAAQVAALRRLCRRLRLAPGHELLDLGGGWGALARIAAREYGARVLTLVRNEAQAAVARDRLRAEKLGSLVRVECATAGDLPSASRFDRIVGVGLAAPDSLGEVAREVASRLRDGGLFLGHFITARRSRAALPCLAQANDLIRRHVFPAGSLPALGDVVSALQGEGLRLLGVEGLRPHMARTLEHWSANLDRHLSQARHLLPERQLRQWRLHLAGGAYAFRHGWLQAHEVLAGARRD